MRNARCFLLLVCAIQFGAPGCGPGAVEKNTRSSTLARAAPWSGPLVPSATIARADVTASIAGRRGAVLGASRPALPPEPPPEAKGKLADHNSWLLPQAVANASQVSVYTSPDGCAEDRLIAYVSTSCGEDRIVSYGSVDHSSYQPYEAWTETIDAPLDGTAPAWSGDKSQVIVVSSRGTVYAFSPEDDTNDRVQWNVSLPGANKHSSPLVNRNECPEAVYVADESGHITKLDESGQVLAQVAATSGAGIHADLWMTSGNVLFAASDDGQLRRFDLDLHPRGSPTSLCTGAGGACSSADQIWNIGGGHNDQWFFTVNNQLWRVFMNVVTGDCVEVGGGNHACAASIVASFAGSPAINRAAPVVDSRTFGGAHADALYAAFGGKTYRCPFSYPTAWTSTQDLRYRRLELGSCDGLDTNPSVTRASGSFSLPLASPMLYDGGSHLYLLQGDGDGYLVRWTVDGGAFDAGTTVRNAVWSDPYGAQATCDSVQVQPSWRCVDEGCTDTLWLQCATGGSTGALVGTTPTGW